MTTNDRRAPTVEHLQSDCTAEDVVELLLRDGALIIDSYADLAAIEQIRTDMRPYLDACPAGRDRFVGIKTARAGAVMARSTASHQLALDPMLTEACGAFLAPYTRGFQLHLTQVASIGGGEGKQPLHRDRGVWGGHVPRSIETQFSTIWALTDFTKDNGATQVVPGSHLWDDDRIPLPHEIAYAEMDASSVLVYTGSVLHGGGCNTTEVDREGLLLHNTLDWLRQEENQYITCPPHVAQHFSPELRALIGYKGAYGMGFFSHPFPPGEGAELVSPECLFRYPATHWPGIEDG